MIEFLVVQHAEKEGASAQLQDPGLTERGRRQARLTGAYLRPLDVAHLYTSPLRRAWETAELIAAELGMPPHAVHVDARLRERMNWGDGDTTQSLDDFLREWARATQVRDFTPSHGDSSEAAGDRFRSLLEELVGRHDRSAESTGRDGAPVVLVAHGGVTVDLLRTLFGDEAVRAACPNAIEQGVPSCGVTRVLSREGRSVLKALGSVTHLTSLTDEVGGDPGS